MASKVSKIEKSIATIIIEVSPEDFEKAVQSVYIKRRGKYNIDGFRKGKAPRELIERQYGKGVFFENAIDEAFPIEYDKVIRENKLNPVATPVMLEIMEIGKEEGLKMVVEVALEPEFELCEYKGIEIEPIKYKITKEDMETELEKVKETNSRLITIDDRKSKSGDTLIIDFEGFVDGAPFEGGKAEKYSLLLGSNTFIPGFEDQLIDKALDEDVEVKVQFPKEYGMPNLAGKDAVFKVKVHEIKQKEMPVLDDEFAKDVSEFDTLEEYKKDLEEQIKKRKEGEIKKKAEATIVNTLAEKTQMDIPEQLIEDRKKMVKEEFENRLRMSGMDPKMYFDAIKAEEDGEKKMEDSFAKQALKDIKTELIFRKLVEVEDLKITEEEMNKEYDEYAKSYNQTPEEFKKSLKPENINYINSILLNEKLLDLLIENAVQKEKK